MWIHGLGTKDQRQSDHHGRRAKESFVGWDKINVLALFVGLMQIDSHIHTH